MNNTTTPTESKPMRHATLYTVLDKVERVRIIVDAALTGTVLDKDENGKEIPATPETIYRFILEESSNAIDDLRAISAEIEELTHYHEQGLISLSVMNTKTGNFIDPQGINKEPSSHKA